MLEQESETPDDWIIFCDAIVQGAENTIPKKTTRMKQKWMTTEILEMMDQRRAAKQVNVRRYKELDRNIKRKCNEERENDSTANVKKLRH